MRLQLRRFKDEKALGKEAVNGGKARVSPIMKSNSASLSVRSRLRLHDLLGTVWIIVILRRFRLVAMMPRNVELFFMFLFYLSDSINPFIYAGMNPAFRREFHKIFSCKHWHEADVADNRRAMSEVAAQTPNMEFFGACADRASIMILLYSVFLSKRVKFVE